ncbi:AraC family transcriptional regulator [Armatimonas rosea]|uniref:AraC-like DNA-binding protein n=1 Tax=Armatimonas rosea TaxID=685828 RepID=A0A7W9W8X4_ARMRO|nr:AraC family transcriptional regulator [Armatimonas rosea]MBB6052711.1 AraC-like DNA-binding protein [Armatimonas rosea]
MSEMVEQERLLEELTRTALGRLILTGEIQGGHGVRTKERWRVYGSYAVVVVTRGRGRYQDSLGVDRKLGAGDVIFVFPDLPHRYGPPPSQSWDELYVTFDGPIFDLWRHEGLLNPAQPVCSGGELGLDWGRRLQALLGSHGPQASPQERLAFLHHFLELLAEPLLRETQEKSPTHDDWLARACVRLETQLEESLSLELVAQEVGLGYETFRKRFQQAKGVSPARYRMQCRIALAQQLLRFSPQRTNQQVAESLGFADAFHFSRRFTELVGETPRAFRRRGQQKVPSVESTEGT